ncbi:hypothetical protein EBU71_21555 [bacterium]|nr:hypothetical protein [Candidatus Elulimicrobium humile]
MTPESLIQILIVLYAIIVVIISGLQMYTLLLDDVMVAKLTMVHQLVIGSKILFAASALIIWGLFLKYGGIIKFIVTIIMTGLYLTISGYFYYTYFEEIRKTLQTKTLNGEVEDHASYTIALVGVCIEVFLLAITASHIIFGDTTQITDFIKKLLQKK